MRTARKILGSHDRAKRFLAYGEGDAHAAKVEAFRVALGKAQ